MCIRRTLACFPCTPQAVPLLCVATSIVPLPAAAAGLRHSVKNQKARTTRLLILVIDRPTLGHSLLGYLLLRINLRSCHVAISPSVDHEAWIDERCEGCSLRKTSIFTFLLFEHPSSNPNTCHDSDWLSWSWKVLFHMFTYLVLTLCKQDDAS